MSDGLLIKFDSEYTPHAIGSELMEVLSSYYSDVKYFRSMAIEMGKADQVQDFDSKAQALLEVGQRLKARKVITGHAYKVVFSEEESRQELAKVKGLHSL